MVFRNECSVKLSVKCEVKERYLCQFINSNKFLGASFLRILLGKMLQQNNRTNQEKEREGNPKWWIQPKNVVKESPQMAGLENNQANDQEQRS